MRTAIQALTDAFFKHVPKAKAKGVLSEFAVIAGAKSRLASVSRHTGDYVFPLVFAIRAKKTNLVMGPVKSELKRVFLRGNIWRHSARQRQQRRVRNTARTMLGQHIFATTITSPSSGLLIMSRKWLGRLVEMPLEFLLNIVRMLFRFQVTNNIRIGGGYIWEVDRSAIYFANGSEACFTTSKGPWSSTLGPKWTDEFQTNLGQFRDRISGYLSWLLSGKEPDSPVQERLRYATDLIAETYSEPHDYARLVRVISALEALAMLEPAEKAKNLALQCSYVGAWAAMARACDIYEDVTNAYRWRNAIVHGDAPAEASVRAAFLRLERFLLQVFIGFFVLFEIVQSAEHPKSIRGLRREFRKRLNFFCWNPWATF